MLRDGKGFAVVCRLQKAPRAHRVAASDLGFAGPQKEHINIGILQQSTSWFPLELGQALEPEYVYMVLGAQ